MAGVSIENEDNTDYGHDNDDDEYNDTVITTDNMKDDERHRYQPI